MYLVQNTKVMFGILFESEFFNFKTEYDSKIQKVRLVGQVLKIQTKKIAQKNPHT